MPEREYIIIEEYKSWPEEALSNICALATLGAFISFGVFLDSAAMQWAGALIGFIALFSKASGRAKRFNSIEAARAHLDALEDDPDEEH